MLKMRLLPSVAFLAILFFITSCEANKQPEDKQEAGITGKEANPAATEDKVVAAIPDRQQMLELLQGKWRHVEDTTNFLVFENGIRKEFAAGMEAWDEEPFVLADKCQNESDKGRGQEEGVRYLSTPESDLCWLIEEVSETSLVLIYLGRGNMLSYTRANE